MRQRYVVTCLAGHGIGPEVMAEASRALAEVSRLHGFSVEEVHAPFGGEAVPQGGHPLPRATRRAALGADAVLVAGAMEPALDGVRADLDLRASVVRLVLDRGGVLLFAPLDDGDADWTIERAFQAARARAGRLASVGLSPAWARRVDRRSAAHDGIIVAHLPLGRSLQLLAAGSGEVDVVVAEQPVASALANVPARTGGPAGGGVRLAAAGLLSRDGPGLFGPTHGAASEIAGQGVANPSEMLLAAALMLGEGLGRRAAAGTLEDGLAAALRRTRTPDVAGAGVAATTREFVDVILGLLPSARRDTEFALGGAL